MSYSVVEAMLLKEHLTRLALKHVNTKFVCAIATKVIENFLDKDCPGLIFYKNGDPTGQIIPAKEVLGGKRMTKDAVEYVLMINH